jgi:Ca2+-binding EF-hand superfamily protein
MLIALIAGFLAVQPPAPVSTRNLPIPTGQAPVGTSPVPLTEVAEPLALALASFDQDHDGRTSRVELEAQGARSFAAADSNQDGALGYIEYGAWATVWLGSQSALPGPFALDADGDNRITRDEFSAELRRQFARVDANADGAVTHAELLTIRSPRMAPVLDRDGRPLRVRQRRQGN